ncbi:M23 family metallopeptidase [Tsuneonella sp. YG55]|uniref:M23 family metallopeptidase n=1 Tax=Tsuneonella litorea TaxID=2976475 RepID=A0A9X2W2S5_9SPHN|nr:M23 family metallopeptidase [Tsuneonella litorea]MCT2558925.1 M23 family metallopeptidase [Tsuneonella litorea]
MAWRPVLALAALLLSTGAADPGTENVHVVAEGETLSGIAARAGVPAPVIAEANGLREPHVVRAGQTLAIPRQRTHSVKPGETGYAIARRYGVPFDRIAIANGLDEKGTLRSGQKLIIPAMVEAPAAGPLADAPPQPYFRAPHDGSVLLGYAVRADGKGHDGIDYAANPLDMVRAAASGTVSGIAERDPRLGRLVTVDHGNGWKSAYGHLARITVAMGDVVKAGERIGLAGNSGSATRTEVHFAIRRNGKPVDPAGVLAR